MSQPYYTWGPGISAYKETVLEGPGITVVNEPCSLYYSPQGLRTLANLAFEEGQKNPDPEKLELELARLRALGTPMKNLIKEFRSFLEDFKVYGIQPGKLESLEEAVNEVDPGSVE